MPGRKKGRQRGSAGSKAQCARNWHDTLRNARDDLASDRRARFVRGGDSAPPRLSVQGFRALATLLHQRARADEVAAVAPAAVRAARATGTAGPAEETNYFSTEWTDNRPRRARTLLSLCISQIGRDFVAYRADDHAVAQAFLLLPSACLSRLSRAAAASGSVADHNIGLLCSPLVSSLWLRGRFTDKGAEVLLPALRTADAPKGGSCAAEGVGDLAEVYRDSRVATDDAVDDDEVNESPRGLTMTPFDVESVCEAVCEDGGEMDDWETADDRIEASLHGGVSLTSLDVSSPRISSGFVERLVLRIPTLRRLGLRGSLGVVGGPDAVCDHVPRLTALRELDMSHCTWFCDTTLRRFAKALVRGCSSARSEPLSVDRPYSRGMIAKEQLDECTSGWGAASATSNTLEVRERSSSATLGTGGLVSEVIRVGRGSPAGTGSSGISSVAVARWFRTFTLTCARTAVSEKGARAAEALCPGLLVVLKDQAALCTGALLLTS